MLAVLDDVSLKYSLHLSVREGFRASPEPPRDSNLSAMARAFLSLNTFITFQLILMPRICLIKFTLLGPKSSPY